MNHGGVGEAELATGAALALSTTRPTLIADSGGAAALGIVHAKSIWPTSLETA